MKLHQFLFLLSELSSQFDLFRNETPVDGRPVPAAPSASREYFYTGEPFSSLHEPALLSIGPPGQYRLTRVITGTIPFGLKYKRSDGVFIPLRSHEPASLLVTADDYAVGKLSSFGQNYLLLAFYLQHYGQYTRVKIPITGGHPVAMNSDEIHQFPERHEFRVPTVSVRHNRGYHSRRQS